MYPRNLLRGKMKNRLENAATQFIAWKNEK